MLRAAAAAPSQHNTQPWRFEILADGTAIDLLLDTGRLLAVTDPSTRGAHIACGAALFNLRIAASVAGLAPRVTLRPDPGRPFLLARTELDGAGQPAPWERELHAAIPARHTNREPFASTEVPLQARIQLAAAAEAEGAVLSFPDPEEAMRLRGLAEEAERELHADPAYLAELANWVGGRMDTDGIPAGALGPRPAEGAEAVRDFSVDRRLPVRYAWFEEHPQLAVLGARPDNPAGWLIAGQALERVWLTATRLQISASPLTQPLETMDAWLVAPARATGPAPQMILRIGYGLPVQERTPRRPVSDFTVVADFPQSG